MNCLDKKESKWIIVVCMVFLLVIVLLTVFLAHNDQKSDKAHPGRYTVTQTLTTTTTDKSLHAYDFAKADLPLLIGRLRAGRYHALRVLLYSDQCPRCQEHRQDLAQYLSQNDRSDQPIIYVNNPKDDKRIGHYFELPVQYHYPTVLSFTGETTDTPHHDNVLIATKIKPLYQ